MKRVMYNNEEHVLSREYPGRTELVRVRDGSLVSIPGKLPPETETFEKHQYIVPMDVPFHLRDRSFVAELHARRLAHLLENRNKRRRGRKLDKSPGSTEPKIRKPRASKKSKGPDPMVQLMAMAAKLKGGQTVNLSTPMTDEKLKGEQK
jgi:hypothetical protein